MKILTGEIGTLKQNGEQVGGFKYWTVTQITEPLNTKVTTSQFWMFKKTEGKLEAEFYADMGDRLKLIYTREVEIKFPEYELDTLTNIPLTMDLRAFNWINKN